MSPTCADCGEGLVHCHEAVVVHGDGGWECLAVGCTVARAGHVLLVACAELEPPCGCAHA